jgi:hypothetical protein
MSAEIGTLSPFVNPGSICRERKMPAPIPEEDSRSVRVAVAGTKLVAKNRTLLQPKPWNCFQNSGQGIRGAPHTKMSE